MRCAEASIAIDAEPARQLSAVTKAGGAEAIGRLPSKPGAHPTAARSASTMRWRSGCVTDCGPWRIEPGAGFSVIGFDDAGLRRGQQCRRSQRSRSIQQRKGQQAGAAPVQADQCRGAVSPGIPDPHAQCGSMVRQRRVPSQYRVRRWRGRRGGVSSAPATYSAREWVVGGHLCDRRQGRIGDELESPSGRRARPEANGTLPRLIAGELISASGYRRGLHLDHQ